MGGIFTKKRSGGVGKTGTERTSIITHSNVTHKQHTENIGNLASGSHQLLHSNMDQTAPRCILFVLRRNNKQEPEKLGQRRIKHKLELTAMQRSVQDKNGEFYLNIPTEVETNKEEVNMDIEHRILTVLLCHLSESGYLDLSSVGLPGQGSYTLAHQLFEMNKNSHSSTNYNKQVSNIYFFKLNFNQLPSNVKQIYTDIINATNEMYERMRRAAYRDSEKWNSNAVAIFKRFTEENQVRKDNGVFVTPIPYPPGQLHPDIFDQIFRRPEVFGMENNGGRFFDWNVCVPEQYFSDKFRTEFGN